MGEKAYFTTLSTENYLPGVIALNQALKNVHSKYPLYALTKNLSVDCNIHVIDIERINGIPNLIISLIGVFISPLFEKLNHCFLSIITAKTATTTFDKTAANTRVL